MRVSIFVVDETRGGRIVKGRILKLLDYTCGAGMGFGGGGGAGMGCAAGITATGGGGGILF